MASSILCRNCAGLRIEYAADDPTQEVVLSRFQVHDELPALPCLTRNANLGCEFCGLLAKIVRSTWERRWDGDMESGRVTPVWLANASFYTEYNLRTDAVGDENGVYALQLDLHIGDTEAESLFFSVHADDGTYDMESPRVSTLRSLPNVVTAEEEASRSGRIQRRRLEPNALSEMCTSRMHGWIQECERNHPVCRLTAKPFKPTRLIDVGTQDAPEVKLETEGIPGLRYVALSHCWGPPDPERPILKTESSTITEREKGIPLNM